MNNRGAAGIRHYRYRCKDELFVIGDDQADACLMGSFFAKNAYDLIYIENSEGLLLDFLDSYDFQNKTHNGCSSLETLGISLSGQIGQELEESLDEFFFLHPNMFRLPVVRKGRLVGEYAISRYAGADIQVRYNLFALRWFVKFIDIIDRFLKEDGIRHPCVLTDKEYWEQLKTAFAGCSTEFSLTDEPSDIPLGTDYVLNMKYPEKTRKKLPQGSIPGETIYEITETAVFHVTRHYLQENGIHYTYFAAPDKRELSGLFPDELNALQYQSNMPLLLLDQKYMDKVCGCEVVDVSASVASNGIHYVLTDMAAPGYNVQNGLRHTTGQPSFAFNDIHVFGPCMAQGFLVADHETAPSQLQAILNSKQISYRVWNHGVDRMGSLLNSCLAVLSTPLKRGDHVFEINTCFERTRRYLSKYAVSNYDLINDFQDKHYWFFNHPMHCNSAGNGLIAQRLSAYCGKPGRERAKEVQYFSEQEKDCDLIYIANNIQQYLSEIKKQKFVTRVGERISAIVMTADPFTNGHLYLVETAIASSDYLYVFVVQEETGTFSFKHRFSMVRAALADHPNIRVLPTGELMHSVFTFPEYNFRGQDYARDVDASKEIRLFGELIAPALDITARYFGEEPRDNITRALNSCAERLLPAYGVDVIIVPRKKIRDNYISGSTVRGLAERRCYEALAELVPASTLRFLKDKIGDSPESQILVSLIIPVYNGERYLARSLDSACAQTCERLEILVVNDGSTDGTGAIIDQYARGDQRIKAIRQSQNRGVSAARNAGLEQATGKYIMFLDSDDQMTEDIIQVLFDAAERARADISISRFKKVKQHLDKPVPIRDQYTSEDQLFTGYEASYQFLTSRQDSQNRPFCSRVMFKLFRRDLIGDFRFEPGRSHEDEFFTYKLYRQAARIVYCSAQRYFYLERDDSISKRPQDEKDYLDTIAALRERNGYYKEPVLKKAAYADYVIYLSNVAPTVQERFPDSGLLALIQNQLAEAAAINDERGTR